MLTWHLISQVKTCTQVVIKAATQRLKLLPMKLTPSQPGKADFDRDSPPQEAWSAYALRTETIP